MTAPGLTIPNIPGTGLAWNEDAVEKYAVAPQAFGAAGVEPTPEFLRSDWPTGDAPSP